MCDCSQTPFGSRPGCSPGGRCHNSADPTLPGAVLLSCTYSPSWCVYSHGTLFGLFSELKHESIIYRLKGTCILLIMFRRVLKAATEKPNWGNDVFSEVQCTIRLILLVTVHVIVTYCF